LASPTVFEPPFTERHQALRTEIRAFVLTYHALRRFLDGGDAVREVTVAKLATQRASFELHDRLLSLLGPDPELERAARDSRLGPIGGGTDEIMKEILGRTMGV
jgi:acyl-CoA dehydrogenase